MEHSRDRISSAVEGKEEDRALLPTEDDLGRIIRWGLQDSFSGAEPADDLWPKIVSRIEEMQVPVKEPRVRRRPSFSLTPLVQAVVVSALLLTFGLGVDRNLTTPRSERTVPSTPTVSKVATSQELPDDMLRGYLLARMEKQPPAPQRPGGAHP